MIVILGDCSKATLVYVLACRFHRNQFPVEINGKQYDAKTLQFFGPVMSFDAKSKLFKGKAILWDLTQPQEQKLAGNTEGELNFDYLLHDLLDISRREVTNDSYFDPAIDLAQRAGQRRKQNVYGCCKR